MTSPRQPGPVQMRHLGLEWSRVAIISAAHGSVSGDTWTILARNVQLSRWETSASERSVINSDPEEFLMSSATRLVRLAAPIGLAVSDAPQDNCLRLDRGSRHSDKDAGRTGRIRC